VGVLMAKQGRNDDARKEFHAALAIDATLQQPKAFLDYLNRQGQFPRGSDPRTSAGGGPGGRGLPE
jgi:hypothetical protein